MLKKTLVSLVAASLVAAPLGTGALAKAKKKKGPKPYVSEEITIQTGHPAFHSASGTLLTVTAQEFIRTCAVPASNGADAAVYAIPEEYEGIEATIKAIGTGASVQPHDLDIYLFDESCTEVAFYNAVGTDELGITTKDTAFVLLHNYSPGPVTAHFEL
ncbi:MAG TPA: hypothetical protein VHJ76_03090, partial [Actinomycetota bacterium]|nr:hypothetical protein [Actinomycetota bacterium]